MDLKIENNKTVLSSDSTFYKTEGLIAKTRHFLNADAFLLKLAEGLLLAGHRAGFYRLATGDEKHVFRAVLTEKGSDLNPSLSGRDIVFFGYAGREELARRNDPELSFLLMRPEFFMRLEKISERDGGVKKSDFQKLYRLGSSGGVSFPLLSPAQKNIVETEDKNVLVQGSAGSGKTNVCIDKIIFTACRAYSGKILYSTFSRGLLNETRSRLRQFETNLADFIKSYDEGSIVFLGNDHKKALENRLGIYFSVDDDDKIRQKVEKILDFLNTKVDFFLIEDLYFKNIDKIKTDGREDADGAGFADEKYFVTSYIGDMKNHQLRGKLEKIKDLSYEVIYKEIYGAILGACDPENPLKAITLEEFTKRREGSLGVRECEIVYSIARDYEERLRSRGLLDNNAMSRRLLESASDLEKYSLAIIDEVQDMTEAELCLVKMISRKVFAVGDALQMINPSYFSFAYLKRLLFEKDTISVAELVNNYRSTKKIGDIAESLSRLNTGKFGVHSFVLGTKSVDDGGACSTVYIKDKDFLNALQREKFNNYTVVVSGAKEKQEVRKKLPQGEILTVSEVKGLERDAIVLYRVLSDNFERFSALNRLVVARKQADENSVYRYYFNLFYVGISRAKTRLYVAEEREIPLFEEFFKNNFDELQTADAVKDLLASSNIKEIDRDEIAKRTLEFIKSGQFDNARISAERMLNADEKREAMNRIEVYETYVLHGKYREAGVRFWELNMREDAKEQFEFSRDDALIAFLEAYQKKGGGALNYQAAAFLEDKNLDAKARDLIFEVMTRDAARLLEEQKKINSAIKTNKVTKRK
ncbi:MAG: UvrD-helicase domain-containing protein [Clostridiales bacterium]|jgi:superfamily I DNA/RNA helicase|nr:UvrD-helicase domain-containing protein [Clostridiales bacterium]